MRRETNKHMLVLQSFHQSTPVQNSTYRVHTYEVVVARATIATPMAVKMLYGSRRSNDPLTTGAEVAVWNRSLEPSNEKNAVKMYVRAPSHNSRKFEESDLTIVLYPAYSHLFQIEHKHLVT